MNRSAALPGKPLRRPLRDLGAAWRRVLGIVCTAATVCFAWAAPAASWAEDAPAASAADPAAGADPAAASTALLQADAARDEGRWHDAAEAYWQARKANLADYRTHARYQEMCLKAGDKLADLLKDYDALATEYATFPEFRLLRLRLEPAAKRLAALEALRKDHGASPDLALELADAALAVGEPAKAQKALAEVQGKVPAARADEAFFLWVETAVRLGDGDAARKKVEDLLKTRPDHREALLLLVRLDLEQDHFEPAVAGARKVLLGRPLHLAGTLLLAEALSRSGKRDEAIAALENPLRIVKDLPEVLIPLAGLAASQETDVGYARALELYGRVTAGPLRVKALYGQGWVLERQAGTTPAKWKEAEDAYRKAMAEDPSWARAVHSVGYCAMKQGRVSEAQVQFRKALDLDGTLVPALLDLGATFDLQADYAGAIKQYEKVLKTKGHEQNLRALVNCAFDHEALGAFNKAADILQKAHKIAPDDPDIMVWIGDNLYFQEKFKDAAKWYQQAVQKDPKSFFGWRGLGFALGHEKRWVDAAAALEKARAIKPTDLDVLLGLGDIYSSELEEYEKALTAYEEYLAAGGQDPSVQGIIDELKKELGK
jgi:tetratricopeptide (TPR) repeat protein